MSRIMIADRPGGRDVDAVPIYDAEVLLDGGRKAAIVLGEQIYTLQITKQGKLLLTK